MNLRVLLVEDSETDAKLVLRALRAFSAAVDSERVQTAEAMREALGRQPWDIVLSDWSMPAFSAPAALAVLRETGLDIPFIIVSGTIGEETAVAAMRAGANDYVLKDKLARLVPAIERELRESTERKRAEAETARLAADAQAQFVARLKAEEALRASEEQLRQAQKMEAVGRLAGGVAHDFNNVLSVILSYAEIMQMDLKPQDPMQEDLEEICKAAERAAALTRQLLLLSRQQIVETKILDLNEILKSMDKMLQRILGEDVELVSLTNRTAGRVRADASHIEQVILNLVVNARDAMPTGGKLTIETADVLLDDDYAAGHLPAKSGSYVMLAVTDTGHGIDKATQARIFEPFFTTKEKGKGTGLGLSTVFGIVHQSGGHLWVYSEPQKGTTFKVYLPRVLGELENLDVQPPRSTLRGSETILLVEDDEQVRTVAMTVLRKQGYRVIAAQNGGEALLRCEQLAEKIDLLITDVIMPQMSGPELAKRLAQTRPEMKVLCMSGYTDDSIVRHGVLEAGVAFLQKPFTPQSLATKVREVLDPL